MIFFALTGYNQIMSPTSQFGPAYDYSPFVVRERPQRLHTNLDYDPRVFDKWKAVLFRQRIAALLFPTTFMLMVGLTYSFGNVNLYITDLHTILLLSLFINFLIIPFSLVNFRCPNCGMFVTGSDPLTHRVKLIHYFANFRATHCPNCHTRLR